MGALHKRDALHRTLVRLEDAGCSHRELRGARHYRHEQEEDRLALLQQRSPRSARRHHQTTGRKSGFTCSSVLFLPLLHLFLISKVSEWIVVECFYLAGHREIRGRARPGARAMAGYSRESASQRTGRPQTRRQRKSFYIFFSLSVFLPLVFSSKKIQKELFFFNVFFFFSRKVNPLKPFRRHDTLRC